MSRNEMKLVSLQSKGPMLAKITEAERNGYRVECITFAAWLGRHLTVSMRWCKTRKTAFRWARKYLEGGKA